MKLSCIVLTSNSYAHKGGCVEHVLLALARQRAVDRELIVVENSGEGPSRDRLTRFLREARLRDVRVVATCTSVAAGRNAGARRATGDVLVFVDDDAIALDGHALSTVAEAAATASHGYGAQRLWTRPLGWFQRHARELREDVAAGRFGRLRRHLGPPAPGLRQATQPKYLMRSFVGHFGFVRAREFTAAGGFPEDFTGYALEDDALSFLLYHRRGGFANLGSTCVAHVSHPVPALLAEGHEQNRPLYTGILNRHGVRSFHIGDLLEPASAPDRRVCEPLAAP